MRLTIGVCMLASGLAGCSSRIEKLPVPVERRSQAYQHMAKGDRLLREGKDHFALISFIEASTLDPYNEIIFNKLAITYSRLTKYMQAKKAVDRAIRLNPDYAFAFNTRGIVFLGSHQPRKAARSFQRAIELRPDKPGFYLNLGSAYFARREYGLWKAAVQKAFELDPQILNDKGTIQVAASGQPDPEGYYQMAVLYAERGDRETTLYYLNKAFSNGFRDIKRVYSEVAFQELRADEGFAQLIQSYGLQI